MGLHECGHVRLLTTVCVLPGQMCDRGNAGVVETGSETGDDEWKKKGACLIRCSAAKRPSVPAASSQWGQAVRDAGETMRSPEWVSRHGILLPTAVSDSIATWKHPWMGSRFLTQPIPIKSSRNLNSKAHDSILTPIPWLQTHNCGRSHERHQLDN